jgi:hypothetical protein
VTVALLFVTRFHLLYDDARGYLVSGFALVWLANVYMSLFRRLRLEIKGEQVEVDSRQAAVQSGRTPGE